MMNIKTAVSGLARVRAKIETKPLEGPHMKAAWRDCALLGQREARRNAPRDEGTLETAIQEEATEEYAEIYVPQNSYAGDYAKRMHDGKSNPGPGTRQKGSRAGRLYIKRAIHDNRGTYKKILQHGLRNRLRAA